MTDAITALVLLATSVCVVAVPGSKSPAYAAPPTMLVGGGLDIGLRKGIGLRLVQADWLLTKFGDQTQDQQGRVSAGIVIKF